jgi:hypothetical protein
MSTTPRPAHRRENQKVETPFIGFYVLAGVFGLFVLFLYGPTLTILALSFQGPQGGLTFPMNGRRGPPTGARTRRSRPRSSGR